MPDGGESVLLFMKTYEGKTGKAVETPSHWHWRLTLDSMPDSQTQGSQLHVRLHNFSYE